MSKEKDIDYLASKIFDYFLVSKYFIPSPSRGNVYKALYEQGYVFKKRPHIDDYYESFRKFLLDKGLLKNFKIRKITTYKKIKSKMSKEEADTFYNSWEWKRIRYQVLKERGARCSICGADNTNARIVVDHIKPLRQYPELALEKSNLQVLCDDCNKGKSNF